MQPTAHVPLSSLLHNQFIHAENKHIDAFIPPFPGPQGPGQTPFRANNCSESQATAGLIANGNLTLLSSPLGSQDFTSRLQTSHRD